MEQATSVIVLGAINAAVLAVAAVAFTLQFGVTNYFNFGYGEWLTFGAYTAFMLTSRWVHLNIWVALALSGVVTAALSIGLNRAVFSPFVNRRRDPFFILIVTFAVGFMLNQLFIMIWGTDYRQLPQPAMPSLSLGTFRVGTDQLIFLGVALACMVTVQLVLTSTRIGKSMRAVADNRSLAAVCGLDIQRIADITWVVTGFMAGLAGVILALQTASFSTDLGDNYVYLVFPAVIIGGIGRPTGALLGAILIGVFGAVGALYIPPSLSTVLIFIALVATVLLRPEGLLGSGRRPSMSEA
jgi:branched-subunit amino acid ABC-type transport system permease component